MGGDVVAHDGGGEGVDGEGEGAVGEGFVNTVVDFVAREDTLETDGDELVAEFDKGVFLDDGFVVADGLDLGEAVEEHGVGVDEFPLDGGHAYLGREGLGGSGDEAVDAVEDREDDDEGGGADGNADNADEGDDVDGVLFLLGEEVAAGNEYGEFHGVRV